MLYYPIPGLLIPVSLNLLAVLNFEFVTLLLFFSTYGSLGVS